MKIKAFAGLMGAMLLAAGCVSTVSEKSAPGIPFVKDRIEGRYERPLDQVFRASKDVLISNGTLINEGALYTQTNAVKTLEGVVNQRNVWIRVEAVDPKITAVTVQTRTPGRVGDLDLAHQMEKEIALKLQAMGQ